MISKGTLKLLLGLLVGDKEEKQEKQRQAVLIIDDDQDYCEIIEGALVRLGFRRSEIETAHNLCDAEDILNRRQFFAYILDQNFPGKRTGLQFDREMRVAHPEVRSIILAGDIVFPHPSGVSQSAPDGTALLVIRKPIGGGLSESLGDALRMNGHYKSEPKPSQIIVSTWFLMAVVAIISFALGHGVLTPLLKELLKDVF